MYVAIPTPNGSRVSVPVRTAACVIRGAHRMDIRVGLDVLDVERVRLVWQRRGGKLLRRTMTGEEQSYCTRKRCPAPHLAGTLAAKEAVFKVLGVAPRWREVCVRRLASGEPSVDLRGSLLGRAQDLCLTSIRVSISHTDGVAVAVAVGVCG